MTDRRTLDRNASRRGFAKEVSSTHRRQVAGAHLISVRTSGRSIHVHGGNDSRAGPELEDWLTESVVLAADPQLRAERICAVVGVLQEAVEWRAGWEGDAELASIRHLTDAAAAHRLRMPLSVAPS